MVTLLAAETVLESLNTRVGTLNHGTLNKMTLKHGHLIKRTLNQSRVHCIPLRRIHKTPNHGDI